jgi:uncharacterized Zn-finger protein
MSGQRRCAEDRDRQSPVGRRLRIQQSQPKGTRDESEGAASQSRDACADDHRTKRSERANEVMAQSGRQRLFSDEHHEVGHDSGAEQTARAGSQNLCRPHSGW